MSGIESHGLQGSTENSWNDLHGCFRGFPARAISDCKMRQGIRARFRDRTDAGRAERGRRCGLSDPMIRAAYCGAQWNGPAQGMVDPVKEVSAAEKRIEIGISTRQRETTELLGGDFESNVAQLAREKQIMQAAGLSSGKASSGGADAGKENLKESEEETDAEGTESDGDAAGEDGGESEE